MSNLRELKKHRPGQFQPGQSGNPSGRPKADATLRELAREYTEEAINTLREIMNKPGASDTARVHAATALLDRAHGKPLQAIQTTDNRTLLEQWQDFCEPADAGI